MANALPCFDSIFCGAIALGSAEARAAYIAGACGEDRDLRDRVEKLVTAHFRAGTFMEAPAAGLLASLAQEVPGAVIGPYKLLEQIGEGGFGVVFMAEQMQPLRRKVALKVLKPGMDTRQVVARFEAERQALALMDHPNIAHVFDGGETASGRPYFVMELVRGVPITDFCDQNQLPVRQRLDLFVTVCQAVQHAHQKGIIHRDLKPTNVMVTLHDDKPVVKVIDFGIAKATGQQLTEKTMFTNFAQMIGTPLYMSPEQAQLSGLDVDTRSDIYSLGVLLYELLTGTTPFDQERLRTAAYDEIRRIIREEEPPRPSTRLSTLGQAVATVSANRGSDPKRLRQLCRGELDWIVMRALEKDRNRRYETANGLARDVERYLKDETVQACPPSATYRLRKLARRHKAALTTTALLLATLVLGTVVSLWQTIQATIAKNDAMAARIAESDAKQRAQEMATKATKDLEQLNAANSFIENGRLYIFSREWAKAESAFSNAIGCARDSSHVWTERAEFYLRLGLWDLAAADSVKAFERREPDLAPYFFYVALLRFYDADMNGYRQTCKLAEQRFAGSTDQLTCQYLISAYLLSADPVVDAARLRQLAESGWSGANLAWRLEYLGMAHYRTEDYKKALERVLEAQAQARELKSEWEPARIHADLAMIYHRLDQPDLARQELDAADKSLDQRIKTLLKENQPDSLPTYWWEILIAELRFREAKTLIDRKPPPDPRLWVIRGRTLVAIGREAEAAASFTRAIDVDPYMLEARTGRAAVHSRLAEWAEAKADYKEALALAPKDTDVLNNYAWLLVTCPQAELRDPKEAVALAEKAVALTPQRKDNRLTLGSYRNTLGVARYRAGDWRRAVTDLLQSVALRQGGNPFDWFFLAMAQWRLDQKDTARQWFAHAQHGMKKTPRSDDAFQRLSAEATALGLADEANPEPSPLNNVAFYTLVLATDPRATWAYDRRGTALAEQKQWQRAAADFAQAVEAAPDGVFYWYYQAMAHLGAEDLESYRSVCAGMRARFGKTTDPAIAARLVFALLPIAEQGADTAQLVQWGKVASKGHMSVSRVLGHALYRDGQFKEAVRHLNDIEKSEPRWVDDELFLAMAQHKLGLDEAHATYARAAKRIDGLQRIAASGGYWSWYDQIHEHHLYREAKALFERK